MFKLATIDALSEKLFEKLPVGEGNRRDFLNASIGGLATAIFRPQTAEARTNYKKIPVPDVGYSAIVPEINFHGVNLAQKSDSDMYMDILSRIQRTERWRNIIEAVEERFGIPTGIIYAVVMNESYGDPLQPNKGGDGGLGLVHFQPGTAREYGLEIFGDSNRTRRDRQHGRDINEMLKECGYQMKCVLEYDDRAHPIKNLDAIARYLKEGYARKGSWNAAIQTINPKSRKYVGRILRFKTQAETHRKAAEADFNERNLGKKIGGRSLTFDFYVKSFWNINRNYGLDKYRRLPKYQT